MADCNAQWLTVVFRTADTSPLPKTGYAEAEGLTLIVPDYENARFHDLRHSYAVAAIESGDDIKTVQANLGHATASFTLDVYGHASKRMRQRSADRMERYIHEVLDN